ncbi:hypothetical protein CGRA01v4_15121 [Colletotrichum graminicola]|nr:hypothetical protein CGRA01v4_15121 [Colletotrichum graminicola]
MSSATNAMRWAISPVTALRVVDGRACHNCGNEAPRVP